MKLSLKQLEDKIESLEKRMDIIVSMINHLNNIITSNTIEKIEMDFEEAVNKKIEEINNQKK